MRVIVTGSRAWMNGAAIYAALNAVLDEYGPFRLAHGACSTGADFIADVWAQAHPEVEIHRFPAAWKMLGKAAGPERNRRMIEAGADLVLAFPLPEGSGTQGTMKLAEAAGIEVRIVAP